MHGEQNLCCTNIFEGMGNHTFFVKKKMLYVDKRKTIYLGFF